MRQFVVVLFLLLNPVLAQTTGAEERFWKNQNAIPIGTIVPKHASPEVFSKIPSPVSIRIINRGKHLLYLQGFRRGQSKTVHFFFYHREKRKAENSLGGRGRGWKPFFESLPCNHPSCRNLDTLPSACEKSEPYVIRLGPAGRTDSVKEFVWNGLLYQKVEATLKDLERRFCYKGLAPTSGRMRIELEYSDSVQRGRDGYWAIGGRDHTAIEFDLPAARKVYVISVGE